MSPTRSLILVLLGLSLGWSPAAAQGHRFEVGRRLQPFERLFAAATPESRRAALPAFKDATAAYFTFRLGEVARQVDRARFALQDRKPSAAERLAASLRLEPVRRLIDLSSPGLPIVLDRVYTVPGTFPEGTRLLLRLGHPTERHAIVAADVPLADLPLRVELDLLRPQEGERLVEGDCELRADIHTGNTVQGTISIVLSLVEELEARLAALDARLESIPPTGIAGATLRGYRGTLSRLRAGESLEHAVPAASLLARAEAVAGAEDPEACLAELRGDVSLSVPLKNRIVSCRLQVPGGVPPPGGWPVVVAVHGVGGTENEFFEVHGPGVFPQLCSERGYLLVAPGSSLLGLPSVPGLLEALAALYPVDFRRVALVGHSLGAIQVLAAGKSDPERYVGLALLSGGHPVSRKTARRLASLPILVMAGEKDFGRSASMSLAASLTLTGHERTTYREVPATEHFTMVQVAAPEILDAAATWFRSVVEPGHR